MALLLVILVAALLVIATATLHYEALRFASDLTPKLSLAPRRRILVVLALAFVAHLVQICLYAAAYFLVEAELGIGAIVGNREGGPIDYFYFSAAMYTTLGIGDVIPTGPMRLVAAVESLNGFVLITWTASFTYLAMEKFWKDHQGRR